MADRPHIQPLDSAHAAGAADALAAAFFDDPMMRWVLPDDHRRRTLLPRFYLAMLRYTLRHGRVDVTVDYAGVALWLPPGRTRMSLIGILRSGMLGVALRLRPAAVQRLWRFDAHKEALHESWAPAVHWYLTLLAVAPGNQSRGIGGHLLNHGLARADAQQVPCYLETNNPQTLRFYQRHGFKHVAHDPLPRMDTELWALLRPPRTPGSGASETG